MEFLAFRTTLCVLGLFFGMLLMLELGRWIGMRRIAADGEAARAGVGAVEGAVFALLGLLIAFTFSGAAARFDTRRQLIVQEVNAIGTAYLRLDLLPVSAQPSLREAFRRYVDSRIETYRKLPDVEAAKQEAAHSIKVQGDIWAQTMAAFRTKETAPSGAILVLPALNQMFDIMNSRIWATQMHPPLIIFIMLGFLVLGSSLLIGYDMAGSKARQWLHVLALATILALSIFVILDLEFPRLGLIRVEAFDQALQDLRQNMK